MTGAPRSARRAALALTLFAVTAAGCGDGTEPLDPPVSRVELSVGDTVLAQGTDLAVRATVRADDGSILAGREVRWSSSAPLIASVDGEGRVSTLSTGSATIAASAGGRSATARIAVREREVAAVRIVPATINLRVGASVIAQAELRDADGRLLDGRPVSWRTADAAIAIVSGAGVVSAVAPGVTTLTASAGDRSAQAVVAVTRAPVATVVVEPSRDTLPVGAGRRFTVSLRTEDGEVVTDRTVTWGSSRPDVATISSAGVVTALAPGVTTVTAASEGLTASATLVVVRQLASTVVVTPTVSTLVVGDTARLAARVTDAQGTLLTDRLVSWRSEQPAIASVDATGRVRADRVGSATIVAVSDGLQGSARVDVVPVPVARVNVAPATLDLAPGAAALLVASAVGADGASLPGRTVSWRSGAPTIAAVDAGGRVTALADGVAVVLAAIDGTTGTALVRVARPPVARVDVTPADPTVPLGATVALLAVPRDGAGSPLSGRIVEWTSDDETIAFVSSTGRVVAVGRGTTTITATCEGIRGSIRVTVP